jgi:hypothetical protein
METIRVYDGLGRLNAEVKNPQNEIHLSLANWPAGMYVLECHVNNQVMRARFLHTTE